MSNLPKEVREAMIAAVVENIGPVIGNPEYLARPGNVERLEARRRNAAASHVDAALSALEAAGWVCVPVEATNAMMDAGIDAARRELPPLEQKAPGFVQMRAAWTAMLAATQGKEQPNV